MNKKFIIFFNISVLFFLGCVTTLARYDSENVYKIFKNTEKPAINFRIKIDKKGVQWGELRSPFIKAGIIKGQVVEDETGDLHFKLESIRYLANWPNGWTEGESEASGEIIFKKESEVYRTEIIEEFEMWDLIKGEIRFHDRYIRDEEGLKEVKNRVERINLVVKFLKENNFPEFFGHSRLKSNFGASFKKAAQLFLFPETVDIDYIVANKNKESNVSREDFTIGAEKIWRKDYTKKVFPEHLQELRDTGSLWRDYEEALDLFFMFYNMDYFFKNVLSGAVFRRVE